MRSFRIVGLSLYLVWIVVEIRQIILFLLKTGVDDQSNFSTYLLVEILLILFLAWPSVRIWKSLHENSVPGRAIRNGLGTPAVTDKEQQ